MSDSTNPGAQAPASDTAAPSTTTAPAAGSWRDQMRDLNASMQTLKAAWEAIGSPTEKLLAAAEMALEAPHVVTFLGGWPQPQSRIVATTGAFSGLPTWLANAMARRSMAVQWGARQDAIKAADAAKPTNPTDGPIAVPAVDPSLVEAASS